MEHATQARSVVPNPRLSRAVGILNIVFGAVLILVGLGRAVYTLYLPAFATMMQAQQTRLEADALAQEETAKAELLAELARRETTATTPAKKAQIEAERAAIRSRPRQYVPNVTGGVEMASNPTLARFNWCDILTGLALNVPMLV